MKFDHVAIPSSNIAQSVEWFRDKFAAVPLYQDDSWAFLNLGGVKLALVSPSQHPPHLALDVDKEELIKQSLETGIPMDTHRDGTVGLYLHDPFGNAIELIHYPPGKTIYQPGQPARTTELARKFEAAKPYPAYVETGTAEQKRRWQQVYDAAHLTDTQTELIGSFTRQMKLLCISGIWCGDCVQQVPLIARIAEANPAIVDLRILDRDEHKDLSETLRINGGDRVPVVLMLSEDHELCALAGDRTLSRYRALVRKQLGPACPVAIAPLDPDELAATLQDWLDEIERVQWMLRLSPRLRERHGD